MRWVGTAAVRNTSQTNAHWPVIWLRHTFENASKADTILRSKFKDFHQEIFVYFFPHFDSTLQNDVKSPKSTRHSYIMTWSHSGGQDEIKTVEMIIETAPSNTDWTTGDRSNSGNCFIYSFVVFDNLKMPIVCLGGQKCCSWVSCKMYIWEMYLWV